MEKLVLEKSIVIDAPTATVWSVVTTPDAMKRWMLVVPEFESDRPLTLGSPLQWKDEQGETYLTGTVVELEPPRKLVLELQDISWTREPARGGVTYALTLVPREKGTELQLVFGDLAIDREGKRWFDAFNEARELDLIKSLAEGRL
ncbi:MAG: SRPBCC domain-containing protein [Gammaproteobacteria bacterium]|nr:hypothetical protein [Gammaproteobacteria bacterium]